MLDKCFLGFCTIDLLIDNCQSLKDKRRVLSSLKEKLKNRFNVALCEFGNLSLWQRTQLGFVTCSNEQRIVDSIIREVTEFIQHNPHVTLLNSESKILPYNT